MTHAIKKHSRDFVAFASQPMVSGDGAAAIWIETSAQP